MFAVLDDNKNPEAWHDLAALIGPEGTAVLTGNRLYIPDGWRILGSLSNVFPNYIV